jgi:hypothetical protein
VAGRDIFGDEQDYWDLGARQSASDSAKIGEVIPADRPAAAGSSPATS